MRLFRQFILRHLAQERLRAGATIFGIALGIAVIVAIQMANASSIRGFEQALDLVAGRTTLEVVGPVVGVDERRLADIAWLRDYGVVSPVIDADVQVRPSDGSAETVRVLGVDLLRDRPLRDYVVTSRPASRPETSAEAREAGTDPDLLASLFDVDAIVLTTSFAERHGVRVGDTVELSLGDRLRNFRVRGLLAAEGPARALGGNFGLMDIGTAQLAFDRLGYLDRLDVRLNARVPVDEAERAIAARLPQGLLVQRPEQRGQQVEKMLDAFQFNLSALSYIALLVGLFLVYNTVAISVIARREEIGTLRAIGTTRRTVLTLFLGEAVVLAIAGCLVGLALGPLLARGAINLTSRSVNILYVAAAAAPGGLEWRHVALAFLVGIPLSLLAAAVPAVEAMQVPPTAAMRSSNRLEHRYRPGMRQLALPIVLLLIAWGLAQLGPIGRRPVFGFASGLALVLGAAFLVPIALYLATSLGALVMTPVFRVEGRLAHANVSGSIPRIAISVAALAVSLSMMVAVAVMVGSFRETVSYWVAQTLRADLFVAPARTSRTGTHATLSPEVEQIVRAHPSVAAVDRFRMLDVPVGDALAILGTGDYSVLIAHGNLLFKAPSDGKAAMRQAIGMDAVVASESFAARHGLAVGDSVPLPTPAGSRPFRVAAIYYDYSSDRGVVVMDHGTFTRHFGEQRPSSLAVYLKAGADPADVRTGLLRQAGDRYRLFIHTDAAIRTQVLRIFDSTFAITYALESIAIAVAIMGVAGTMLTLVLERRKELAMLRLIGADRGQVRRMVLIEAAIIGAVGQGLGIGIGLLLSLVLIYVINVQSFGWTIQFHLPGTFLVQSTALVLIATALSGIIPARLATRLEPVEEIGEE